MSWTSPKTWVATNTLTAAELNTHVRDNFNAAIPVTSTITTTGTQTALAIPDGRGDLAIFCNNASLLTIQGIVAAQNGQTLTIVSIGAGNVAIDNQSGSASAANRIANQVTGTITLVAGVGRVTMTYDSTNSRWRVLQHEQGAWITPTFNAGDFTASGGGTWTVAAGDVTTYTYLLSGRIMTVSWYLQTTSVSGSPNNLFIAIPNGLTATKNMLTAIVVSDGGASNSLGFARASASGATVTIEKVPTAAWGTTTDTTYAYGTISFEVS
jgi:hypothetical protein